MRDDFRCIGSRTGGIVDAIDDGRSGILVTPRAASEISEALTRLGDATVRQSMGASARALARSRFDLSVSVERYAALFERLGQERQEA